MKCFIMSLILLLLLRFINGAYSQSEMNCKKLFVILSAAKKLECAHVDVHEILRWRSG